MFNRIKRRRQIKSVELDITAFMNLMVILVPFLLITAVFSRVTVLDLYLPAQADEQASAKPSFQLEVTIREKNISVSEARSGLSKVIENTNQQYDLVALRQFLAQVKTLHPDRLDANILAEPGTRYEILVKVMDAVRMQTDAKGMQSELFPNIAIGDAAGGEG